MAGTGESVEDVETRTEARQWVVASVYVGYEWDASFWIERFGMYEQLDVDRYNPNIIKAYYFESIDMTLIVNVLEGEIVVWRNGKAHS